MNNGNPHLVYFIHVPRTAGTFVTSFLQDQLAARFVREGHTVPPHALRPWTERFGPVHFDAVDRRDCFTFSVIRNPFDLLVSMYLFGFPYWSPITVAGRQQIDWPFNSFREYLTKLCGWDDYPWICPEQKQSLFFQLFDLDGNCFADIILRHELLNEGLQALGARLGHDWRPPVRRVNATQAHDYRDFFDRELVQMVQTRYAADLETFGYGFDWHDGRATIDGADCRRDRATPNNHDAPTIAPSIEQALTGRLADTNFHPWGEALLNQYSGKQLAMHLWRRVLRRNPLGRAEEGRPA